MDAGLDSLPVDSEWVELLWSLGEAAMLLDERDAARAVHDTLEPYADLWAVDGYGAACFGQVSDLLARLAEYLDRPSATPADRAAFVRTGTVWQLEFRGRSATVLDSKGMRDLAVLLVRPGQEVHVLDLVEAAGGPSRAEAGTDTGPMMDAAARSAYRRRLVDLEEEIDEASRDHDQGRLEKLGAEKEFLVAELSAALGLGGRVRVTGDRDRAGPEGGGHADRDRLEGHRDRASGIGPASAEQRLDRTVLQLPAGPGADLAADRRHLTSPYRMWRLPDERDGPAL